MKFFNRLHIVCIIFWLIFNLSFANASEGSEVEKQLDVANEMYASGKYEEAIPIYREIIGRYGFSAEILLNLGNSYAGAKHYGQAILHYLRGLSIAPGNEDLEGSLEIARQNSGLFQEDKTPLKTILNFYDLNQWTLAALGVYISFTILLLVHSFFPLNKGLYSLCCLHLLLFSICITGSFHQYSQWSGGVVIKPGVRLLMSPFPTALSQGMLDEGSMVFTEKAHGKYHYIKDEKGRAGWVESTTFRKIRASHLIYFQDNVEQ